MQEPEKQETLITLEVPPGYKEEARLDVYITRFLLNASRAKVQRGIKEGKVTVNEKVIRKVSRAVQPGDLIKCQIMRPPPMEIQPEAIPLDIVYEDEDLIVLNKAAGMVVHPAYGHRQGTLVHALLHHVGAKGIVLDESGEEPESEDIGLSTHNRVPTTPDALDVRPGIIHRLDKDTSGLMVVAKKDTAHVRLARQFEERTIRRRYQAIVWGVPDPPKGRIETALGRSPRDRKRMAVVRPEQGKHAITHYRTLVPLRYAALVEFRLETGRTHQIRVHARHIRHPILGDQTYDGLRLHYGLDSGNRRAFFKNLFLAMPRQALHAVTLGFTHPRTGEAMDFTSALPADMQHVWERLCRVEGASDSSLDTS